MKFGHKPIANGSIYVHSGKPEYRLCVRFSIIPRRLRLPTGGSVWVVWEQYVVIQRLMGYEDWDGRPFRRWTHVANATMADLAGAVRSY